MGEAQLVLDLNTSAMDPQTYSSLSHSFLFCITNIILFFLLPPIIYIQVFFQTPGFLDSCFPSLLRYLPIEDEIDGMEDKIAAAILLENLPSVPNILQPENNFSDLEWWRMKQAGRGRGEGRGRGVAC